MEELLPESRWKAPFPYGAPGAIDSMGSVAAPLLAGFALTVATLVITNDRFFRWPSLVLGLLIVAAATLVATVELTFRSRQYAITPADIEVWWPNPTRRKLDYLRREQRYHRDRYLKWTDRARIAYNIGVLTLALGFAVALVPPNHVNNGRRAVIVVAMLAFLAEALWIAHSRRTKEDVELPQVGPEINSQSHEAEVS
jgi:MFS family permease